MASFSYTQRKRAYSALGCILLGIFIGAYLFNDIRTRSLLEIHRCEHCMESSELLGLIGGVVTTKTPFLLPGIVFETDYSVAIKHPSGRKNYFVIIPKRDIPDLGNLQTGDEVYLTDMMTVMHQLIQEYHITDYRIWTNGPGTQAVNYLHFHLQGRERG